MEAEGGGTEGGSTLPPVSEPVNHGQAPPFGFLCAFYDSVAERSKPVERRKLLAQLLQRWRVKVGNNAFPLIRLLIPERDRHRPNYGIKELSLAKVYTKALGLDPNSTAAKSMKNWKRPTKAYEAVGDFAQICYDVIKDRSYVTGTGSLTITSLNTLLDNLADADGEAAKSAIFKKFLEVCTAEEQRWIIRIILKDLRIGLREKAVLYALHLDASDVFDICTDLQYVCYALSDPAKRWPRENKDIHLFAPFKPMLCSFGLSSLNKIIDRMQKQNFIIEEKVDGERIQMHYRKGQFAWFSRKSTRYTYLYGSDLYSGSCAKYVYQAINKSVYELILDGEMLVWMPLEQKFAPFGNLKTFAGNSEGSDPAPDDPRPCFKVFDVLYVNGTSLIRKPLQERRRVLPQLIGEIPGRLEYNEIYRGTTERDIVNHLDDIMERKGEGLVIKNPESQYFIGGRELDWIKVKPEYIDSFGDPPDLVVVGGFWGQGRLRSGKITGFMCGVYDRQKSKEKGMHCFKTFCKLATGFSVSDYQDIDSWCRGKWKEWVKGKTKLSWLEHDHEIPDVYIEPSDSFMIKIKAAGLIEAVGEFATKYTLRFPRAIGFRQEKDKGLDESWSYDDMLEALDAVVKRKSQSSDITFSKKRKAAGARSGRKKAQILHSGSNSQAIDPDGKKCFSDLTFYILEGTSNHSKNELESLVLTHGGDFRQSLGNDASIKVISDRVNFLKAKSVMAKGKHDILRPLWILNSVAEGRQIKLTRKYYAHMTRDTEDHVESDTDTDLNQNGLVQDDEVKADEQQFRRDEDDEREGHGSVNMPDSDDETTSVDPDSDTDPSANEEEGHKFFVAQSGLMDEGARDYDQHKIFRYLCFYVTEDIEDRNNLLTRLEDNGGEITTDVESDILSHYIASETSASDLFRKVQVSYKSNGAITSHPSKGPKRKRIVTPQWVTDCLCEGTLLDEDAYRP